MHKRLTLIMVSALALALTASIGAAADARNVTMTFGANETQAALTQQILTANGGNITNMNVTQNIQTMKWQGYYGNVTNSLQLAGASGTFYEWTTTGTGWILLANSSSVSWGSLLLAGAAHAAEEDTFLGLSAGLDNVSSTLNETNGADITINGVTISAGATLALQTESNGGTKWETSLLRSGTNKIYAGTVNSGNQAYNGVSADYQLMVPVSSTGVRTYYLYAALN
ncbi:hypothetical protein JXA12_06165 [Candidatus Woesearchaeota archaeon]|nr:hypothetical protein [Candidatus Woesearchaeota archaeon]